MPQTNPQLTHARFAWIYLAYLLAIGVAWLTVVFAPESWSHPIALALAADVAATVVIFAFSLAFRNSSFYDAYWSVAPPLLLLFFAWSAGWSLDLRWLVLMALVCWWALRLTHNWAIGWTGLAHEDWRYRDLQQKLGLWYWPVSLLGIHLMPTVWVFLGCLGGYWVAQPATSAWGWLDSLALLVGVASIWLEARADTQLHQFRDQRGSVAEHLDHGVWSWCRHPNYLGEIGFWVAVGLFGSAAAPGVWWVWLGPGAMVLLFTLVSIPMLETKLTQAKPGYAAYAARTFALLPLSKLR